MQEYLSWHLLNASKLLFKSIAYLFLRTTLWFIKGKMIGFTIAIYMKLKNTQVI